MVTPLKTENRKKYPSASRSNLQILRYKDTKNFAHACWKKKSKTQIQKPEGKKNCFCILWGPVCLHAGSTYSRRRYSYFYFRHCISLIPTMTS